MAPHLHLKLGTRKSLLAWAQSGWVAREVERLNPGVTVELVGIETRGDRILDVSLQSVEGKEFFVAELDQALSEGRVDLTVHSMKDLSLERPAAFVTSAVPARENPRDVVLFGPGVLGKIAAGRRLRIGTSSPRRVENVPGFLRQALPTIEGKAPQVELVEIRGNVNTRLGRVHLPEGAEKRLDGVILAMAGLNRLGRDEKARLELGELMRGVRLMVLPLRECPTAPAQGALAIECRAKDENVRAVLGRLHDPATASQVARERGLLAKWGGGCHQKFGATEIVSRALGPIFHVRGVKPGGDFVESLEWAMPAAAPIAGPSWDGAHWRAAGSAPATMRVPEASFRPGMADAVFVAHSRAADGEWGARIAAARVWTSGVPSWLRLAARGLWIEGCAEGLGFEDLKSTLAAPLLGLPELDRWTILTHADAAGDWESGRVLATYELATAEYDWASREALKAAREIFWSSGSQWDRLKDEVSPQARHACGPGKTGTRLRQAGIEPRVFPSAEEWKKWLERK